MAITREPGPRQGRRPSGKPCVSAKPGDDGSGGGGGGGGAEGRWGGRGSLSVGGGGDGHGCRDANVARPIYIRQRKTHKWRWSVMALCGDVDERSVYQRPPAQRTAQQIDGASVALTHKCHLLLLVSRNLIDCVDTRALCGMLVFSIVSLSPLLFSPHLSRSRSPLSPSPLSLSLSSNTKLKIQGEKLRHLLAVDGGCLSAQWFQLTVLVLVVPTATVWFRSDGRRNV